MHQLSASLDPGISSCASHLRYLWRLPSSSLPAQGVSQSPVTSPSPRGSVNVPAAAASTLLCTGSRVSPTAHKCGERPPAMCVEGCRAAAGRREKGPGGQAWVSPSPTLSLSLLSGLRGLRAPHRHFSLQVGILLRTAVASPSRRGGFSWCPRTWRNPWL